MVVESESDGVGSENIRGRIELNLELADIVDSWRLVDHSGIVHGELVSSYVVVVLIGIELMVGEEIHNGWVSAHGVVGLDGNLRPEGRS